MQEVIHLDEVEYLAALALLGECWTNRVRQVPTLADAVEWLQIVGRTARRQS